MTPIIQILLNSTQFITSGTESNWEGFVWSHQSKTGPESPETICPTMRLFGQKTFQMLFFQNIQQIPLILILYFLWRHRFRTLWRKNAGANKSGLFRLNLWLVRKLVRYFPSRPSTHRSNIRPITKHAMVNSSLVVLQTVLRNARYHNKPTLWPNSNDNQPLTLRNDNVDVPEVKNGNRKFRFSLFQCSN